MKLLWRQSRASRRVLRVACRCAPRAGGAKMLAGTPLLYGFVRDIRRGIWRDMAGYGDIW
eukprot:1642067-Prymnesium_polylepis.1